MVAIKGKTLKSLVSSFLGRYPIGLKIILGYIVLVFMMAAGTAAAIWTLSYNAGNYITAIQRQRDISTLRSIQTLLEKQNYGLSDLQLNHNKATLGVFKANSEKITMLLQDLQPDIVSEEEKTILNDISRLNDQMASIFNKKVIPAFEGNIANSLKTETEQVRTIGNQIDDYIQKLSSQIETESRVLTDSAESNTGTLSYSLGASALLGAVIGLLLGIILTRNITGRVKIVNHAAVSISEGDLDQTIEIPDRDEVGKMASAFSAMVTYLRSIANLAEGVSLGNLSLAAAPKSGQDVLGNAFQVMLKNLRNVIGEVRGNADLLGSASEMLSSASRETQSASSQIATTIQQIALGTTRQSEAASVTSESMAQMNQIIKSISLGAGQQAEAVNQASLATQQMSAAIGKMDSSMKIVQQESSNTEAVAQNGAERINKTITEMRIIKEKVGLSTEKVLEMGKRSEEIEGILDTIQDIASQTNLLALNAAIEAARSSGLTLQTSQALLHGTLLAVANFIGLILSTYNPNLDDKGLEDICTRTGVDILLYSDEDGVITTCSDPNVKGYRFSEDPKEQSYEFRALLKHKDGKVLQPVQARSIDNKPFIWVGISRYDKPGIIQAGMFGEVVYRSADYTRGFTVVAEEVRKLAENSTISTKEIAAIIKSISRTVKEAVAAMDEGAREVEAGVIGTGEAGSALEEILKSIATVHRQVNEAALATNGMAQSSDQLLKVMDTVSAVVDENTAATDEMLSKSAEVSEAIENIAAVSEENGAAVEQVSASVEEVSSQIHEISESAAELDMMAQTLRKSMSRFQL